jgi:hypothetical protein
MPKSDINLQHSHVYQAYAVVVAHSDLHCWVASRRCMQLVTVLVVLGVWLLQPTLLLLPEAHRLPTLAVTTLEPYALATLHSCKHMCMYVWCTHVYIHMVHTLDAVAAKSSAEDSPAYGTYSSWMLRLRSGQHPLLYLARCSPGKQLCRLVRMYQRCTGSTPRCHMRHRHHSYSRGHKLQAHQVDWGECLDTVFAIRVCGVSSIL